MTRKHPGQPITNYVRVPSVTLGMAKVKKVWHLARKTIQMLRVCF